MPDANGPQAAVAEECPLIAVTPEKSSSATWCSADVGKVTVTDPPAARDFARTAARIRVRSPAPSL